MDNLQHWYIPKDKNAITSERMVSEIVMMNKLKIKAELKYLKSGAMCWMVYLPADEICKDVWCIALIYNKDFSMPGCKEPFVAMMAKPKAEELIAAIEKGGKMESDLVIPVNPEGKTDMTCVEAVKNLIKWRKDIYPLLDFTPNEELVQEAFEQDAVTKNSDDNSSQLEETNSVYEEQQAVDAEDESLETKQGLTNQDGADNTVDSSDASFVAADDMPAAEAPYKLDVKKCSKIFDGLNDENDGEAATLDRLDKSEDSVDDDSSLE